jgi:hypothetical protein
MRTMEFVKIEGRYEIYAVYENGTFIKWLRKLIRNW